jgi:penicillin-binding protein 2
VRRYYPYGSVAAQTIGYTAKVTGQDLVADPKKNDLLAKYAPTDDIGRDGMEKLFEPQLRGTRGLESTTDTDAGTAVSQTPPIPGADITTTLDVELQKKVEEAFKSVTFAPGKPIPPENIEMPGAAVVIDVQTGEVRAMASWPTYDLNEFDKLYSKLARDQINLPLWNKAIMLDVVPGSTVKPIVGISAISAGLFRPDETIHCDGYLYLNGVKQKSQFRCWTAKMHEGASHQTLSNPHPTGNLTFPEALQRSCNVFHEELALRLGMDRLSEWFRRFGLGRVSGLGLPRESAGLLPDDWRGPAFQRIGTTAMAGIGEGSIHATPIQMANVAATIARGGFAIKPTLHAGEPPERIDLQLNRAAVAEAQKGMFDVVNTDAGTGTMAWLPDVHVAAKTGSAQTAPLTIQILDDWLKPVRNDRGRVEKREIVIGTHDAPNPEAPWYRYTGSKQDTIPAHGWMIGFAPADHPKVAFAVLVEYGGGGGPAAGSVVRRLVEACKDEGYLR